jgi:hypothetical protein
MCSSPRLYTSLGLADKVLEEFQMTLLGTLMGNRKGLPKEFKEVKDRPEGDYMALFEEGGKKSLHSWVTNTKSGPKNVMLLTTKEPIMGRTKDDGKEKPAIIAEYNQAMGGCDRQES